MVIGGADQTKKQLKSSFIFIIISQKKIKKTLYNPNFG